MKNNFEDTIILEKNSDRIKNLELKKYIQFKLGRDNFKLEELSTIKEIILDGKTFIGEENIVDFKEIDLFPNLKEIEVNNLKISQEEILKLKNIEKVTFRKCIIESLKKLTNVKSLILTSSVINDIEDITKLIQIEELELIDLEIEDFGFLRELQCLQKLKIKNIKLFELEKINFDMQIEYISLENIEILTLDSLSKFKNLKYLSVDREEANKWQEELEKIEKNGVKILLNDIYDY